MAPRRRPSKQRGHTRMDAALDAMSPYGFPSKLVRRTVDQLLKVYGGNDGWVFIEDAAYTLLIETLLEKQTIASEALVQDGLKQDNPGDGHNEASHSGRLSRALPPHSNRQTSDAASQTNEAVDTVSTAIETGNQLPIKDADTVSAANETGSQLPIKAADTVSAANETGNQLPIKAVDTVSTVNETDCQSAGNFAFGKMHGITDAYSPPRTESPQPVESLCPRKRRPCHGWISSDDEEDLIQLPPASLPKVLSMLINDGIN